MSSSLISRLNSLKLQKENIRSVGEAFEVIEVAKQLAEDAITEVVASELAIDELLSPAPDSNFLGDEVIK